METLIAFVVGLSSAPLLIERHSSGWLELTLNRPDKLNALSSQLIDSLMEQVVVARSADVTGVLLTAAPGRAFCAGGDIREAASLPLADGRDFLRREYLLMLALKELNAEKPVVALADGFILGAGAGLFMAADARVMSVGSSFAMPECVLGIVPDTGASDFLPMMPGRLGRWAALTGARLDASMMAAAGIATHTILAEGAYAYDDSLGAVRQRILACGDARQLEAALRHQRAAAQSIGEPLEAIISAAGRTFGPSDLKELDRRLAAEHAAALATKDQAVAAWAGEARAKLGRASPAALLVAHECASAQLGLEPIARRAQALGMELVANCALAGRADFQVGVSCAVGAKKGQMPMWQHPSLQAAEADPEIASLLEAVRAAAPLTSSL